MTRAQITTLIASRANGGDNTVATERALWAALVNEACKLYEVKEIDVNALANPTYLANNFDSTGLGINDMIGFAICNGNNGTRNRIGRTSIGYGVAYPTIGGLGGSEDAVLVRHNHGVDIPQDTIGAININSLVSSSNSDEGYVQFSTSEEGESGTGKNMQPYIVTLMIQRIA